MSLGVLDIVGFIAGSLGIWGFGTNLIPDATNQASNYQNAGGGIQNMKTYNEYGALIGSGRNGNEYIGNGNPGQISCPQDNAQQAATTEFYADNDAICLAYITATWPDGQQWGWVGDWGMECGLLWYESGIQLQSSAGNGSSPACTWVDGDHTNGIQAGVIGISWSSFKANTSEAATDTNACGSSFRAWTNDGGDQLLSPGGLLSTRDVASRNATRPSQRMDDRLVVSHRGNANATRLCESETSWGPDFISMGESLYCNMETHELVPLCVNGITTDCFEVDGPQGHAHVATDGTRNVKNTSSVVEWK
ncbi:hypothetical protein F5Y16DRAFT_418286 [Xylariaceae sp. FL0255]|nr:hypothetical protein F5Y16DRAFT_418286 [Xylariaceae sp. FL0255]